MGDNQCQAAVDRGKVEETRLALGKALWGLLQGNLMMRDRAEVEHL